MNKVVLLNEIRKEKTNSKNRLLEYNKSNSEKKQDQEENKKSFADFEKKFNSLKNANYFIDLKNSQTRYEKKLNTIIERVFSFSNKMPLIGLINSMYNDELSAGTKIEYVKNNQTANLKNYIYNIRILAEDDYRKFEYEIKYETLDDQNIAIIISKIDCENNCTNVINLNKKKKEYENIDSLFKESNDDYNQCLIMFNSNIEVPDTFEFKEESEGENIEYKINVMKSWKYDFKQLFEKNMYLLFPMKVLDLRKRLLTISQDVISEEMVKDEIVRFFKDMDRYLIKIKNENLISEKDINEYKLIAIDLLTYFIKEKNNNFVDIKTDIEATLKHLVV